MTYVWLVVGMLVLVTGGEMLVRYASRLALTVRLSPLVVGLTVVAFGTSAPELMASVYGQWIGQGELALGNVVGSNIFNVFGILGVSALVAPLVVDSDLVRREVLAVLVVSLVVVGVSTAGEIGRLESAGLILALVIFTVRAIRRGSGRFEAGVEIPGVSDPAAEPSGSWKLQALAVVVALAPVVAGGRMFVSGATDLARSLGVQESVIGLTVVAFGTSLPELVTSVLATIRGHREIAVGNVVGSNLFNATGVLGLTGLVGQGGVVVPPELFAFDLPVMVASAVVCLPVMATGNRIDRWEGGVFVVYYLGYVGYLCLQATGHAAATTFGQTVMWGVVPLTLLTLAVVAVR
ncbi:MAG: calcium/sodium antiporter, partial [Bradymonadaceae bacterium]